MSTGTKTFFWTILPHPKKLFWLCPCLTESDKEIHANNVIYFCIFEIFLIFQIYIIRIYANIMEILRLH